MAERRELRFEVRDKSGVSNWTDGLPVFEWSGSSRNGSLWVGIDGGPAWFWMTRANARRLRDFLTEAIGDEDA